MARPRKDKFEETSIGFEKETEHELVHVSAPFFVKVTYKEKIGEYNDGKPIYGTTDVILKKSISDEKEIKKEFREKGKKVIKIEENTIYHFLTSVKNAMKKEYQELKENQTNGIIMLE